MRVVRTAKHSVEEIMLGACRNGKQLTCELSPVCSARTLLPARKEDELRCNPTEGSPSVQPTLVLEPARSWAYTRLTGLLVSVRQIWAKKPHLPSQPFKSRPGCHGVRAGAELTILQGDFLRSEKPTIR